MCCVVVCVHAVLLRVCMFVFVFDVDSINILLCLCDCCLQYVIAYGIVYVLLLL